MELLFNGLSNPSNIVCLTDIPNIVKLADEDYGTYAQVQMIFDGTLKDETYSDGQWQITIMGNTITNVMNYQNAVGRTFYVSQEGSGTAASVAKALRNCPTIFSTFKINNDLTTVYLKAREKGSIIGNNFITTNISDQYFEYHATDGTSTTELTNALIDVDVIGQDENGDDDYITTLEKTFANGVAAFNISPVLTTMAELGKAKPFKLQISKLKNGEYTIISTIMNNFVSVGFKCNQGDNYIPLADGSLTLAQNVLRGNSATGDETNKMPLYVAEPTIPISFYVKNMGGMNITIDYLDSAFNITHTDTTTWRNSDSSRILKDHVVELDGRYFTSAHYVDVSLGEQYKLRYQVIKPLNASGYSYRIYWRNEYGGISWADMSGDKIVSNTLEQELYKKQAFDYYVTDELGLERQYSSDVDETVTLQSHLMVKDGTYIFESLLKSPKAWIVENDKKHIIIIDRINLEDVEEDIYRVSVTYRKSKETL